MPWLKNEVVITSFGEAIPASGSRYKANVAVNVAESVCWSDTAKGHSTSFRKA